MNTEYGLTMSEGELDKEAVFEIKTRAQEALARWRVAEASATGAQLQALEVLEAERSSWIEGYETTVASAVFAMVDPDLADKNDCHVVDALVALRHAQASAKERPVSIPAVEEVCSITRGQESFVRKVPGTVIANSETGEVLHRPPEGEENIRNLLAGWVSSFYDEVDTLEAWAKQHLVFESIHPFHDGNGRTGRIYNQVFLLENALVATPALPLSTVMAATRRRYYEGLGSVRKTGDWTPWVRYMYEVLEAAAETGMELLEKMEKATESLVHTDAELLGAIHSTLILEAQEVAWVGGGDPVSVFGNLHLLSRDFPQIIGFEEGVHYHKAMLKVVDQMGMRPSLASVLGKALQVERDRNIANIAKKIADKNR